VIPSAGASRERYVADSVPPVKNGRGPASGSGWREIVIQRSNHRRKRCVGRGTGVVTTTGSYEESLSMEDILDHHEAPPFTRRRPRWSWRTTASFDPCNPLQRWHHGQIPAPRKLGEGKDERTRATGMSEARSHWMPWEEDAHAHDFVSREARSV